MNVADEDLTDVSLSDQIAEVKRELALRERVYPSFVKSGRLKQTAADRDMRRMRAVLKSLLELSAPDAGWRSDTRTAPLDGSLVDLLLDDDEIVTGAAWGEPTDREVLDEADGAFEGWLVDGQWARAEDQRVIAWRFARPTLTEQGQPA